MFEMIKLAVLAALLGLIAGISASAQTTTGTVSMSGTVSKFVEINSGGPATLTGNSGGGITTNGTVNNPWPSSSTSASSARVTPIAL